MILAYGLKYVGVPTYPLGWTMGGILHGRRGVLAGHEAPLAARPASAAGDTQTAPALARQTAEPEAKRAGATADPLDDVPVSKTTCRR